MKRLLMFLVLTVAVVGLATAQSNSTPYRVGGSASADIWAITNWGAFASDSLAYVFSQSFPSAPYDTVELWVLGSSSNGVANYTVNMYGSILGTPSGSPSATYYDSIGVAGDTTSVKLETLQRIGRLPTWGAARLAFAVAGVNVNNAATANRKDAKVNVYAVCYKRPYTGPADLH